MHREHSLDGAQTRFLPFDELYQDLLRGQIPQGVVIHEHRFTYKRDGLHLLQDLGAFWEEHTGSPIPLGIIVAKKSLGSAKHREIETWIRASLESSWARKQLITPFIANHAQETEPTVMEAHIRMFVNDFSQDIGTAGRNALKALRQAAENTH